MMLFRKWLTACRLQITRTLKQILAEATNNFSCCNFHRKRHNKNHLPALVAIHFGQCKSSAENFQAETKAKAKIVKTELN